MVQWAAVELGAQFATSDSIFGAQQPEETVAVVRSFMEGTLFRHSSTAYGLKLLCVEPETCCINELYSCKSCIMTVLISSD